MLSIYSKVCEGIVGRKIEIKSILAAMDAGKHILLEGPPGTSKSTLLRKIACEADIPIYIVEGNIDLTPAKLIGCFNPSQVMAHGYRPEFFEKGPLARAMEEGGLLYIEEFNRMPADVSNALITPMEEGELAVPRYGSIKAVRSFTVISAQNPYDDVGTLRISRAFMDRVCLLKTDYQDETEECEIVHLRTGFPDLKKIALSVEMVRRTRKSPEIKLGASVRASIDLIDLYASLQKISDQPEQNFLTAARMALTNKIWLNETSLATPEKIIDAIWSDMAAGHKKPAENFKNNPDGSSVCTPEQQQDRAQKTASVKSNCDKHHLKKKQLIDQPVCDAAWHSHYHRVASYLNQNPDALPVFFETVESLGLFLKLFKMLQCDLRTPAKAIARRLILKIAKQIADTGYRSGHLKLVSGFTDGDEIELDHTLENYTQAPEKGLLANVASYTRQREKTAVLVMLDSSYSMRGLKMVLAAITAAAVALHFKQDYAVLCFNNDVTVLKTIDDPTGPDKILDKLFALELKGATNMRQALVAGLEQLGKFERKTGLILTDGAWNRGGDPLAVAAGFDKLSVVGFPPSKNEQVRQLACVGKGTFSLVDDVGGITSAIHRCLN